MIDTKNVRVAMNVKTLIDPRGLPNEVPFQTGQVLELTGRYKPASVTGDVNPRGPVAIIHETHYPMGSVKVLPNGPTYA